MKNIIYILFLLPFFLKAQNDCSSARAISEKDTVLSSGWYVFTATSDKLSLLIQDKNVVYQVYERSSSCEAISAQKVNAILTNETVKEVTPAMVELAIRTGRCFCDNCIKAYHKHDNAEAFVVRGNEYLLHIETASPANVKLVFKEFSAPVNATQAVTKKKQFTLKDGIKNLDTGQVYILQEVRFVTEKALFLDYHANEELNKLAAFLNKNPTVKITINGHVNGPSGVNSTYYQTLSEDRAHAVMMYLMEKGIRGARMNTKGFGNTKMIFPAPVNEAEAEANRRVEIVIIAK